MAPAHTLGYCPAPGNAGERIPVVTVDCAILALSCFTCDGAALCLSAPRGIRGREGQKWGQTDAMEVERKEQREIDEIVTERKGSHVEQERKKERG